MSDMDNWHLARNMLDQSWERAKGELRATLVAHGTMVAREDWEKYKQTRQTIDDFIKKMEEEEIG